MEQTLELLDELKDRFLVQISKDLPHYDNGVFFENKLIYSYLIENIDNLKILSNRVKDFNDKLNNSTFNEDQQKLYKGAIDLTEKMILDEFLDNISHSKERYEKEKNIYNSHCYAEFPVSELGYTNKNKTVFALFYSNIMSLENNKNFLWQSIKQDDLLVNLFIKAYYPEKSVEEIEDLIKQETDMYYGEYFNSTNKEQLIKDNTELTHMAISNTVQSEFEKDYLLFGNFDKKQMSKIIVVNTNEELQALLNND